MQRNLSILVKPVGPPSSDGFYGPEVSRANRISISKAAIINTCVEWTNSNNISCFYFEAFDEQWKDASNPHGSENHFGLFTLTGEAKYPLWKLVDQGVFKNLTRGGKAIVKTYQGNEKELLTKTICTPIKMKTYSSQNKKGFKRIIYKYELIRKL
ncbi:MAG: hypothetical protein U5K54_09135 [Cytophagales bacterium]|nr:hypothetical protein [Cytophagales bacterium]